MGLFRLVLLAALAYLVYRLFTGLLRALKAPEHNAPEGHPGPAPASESARAHAPESPHQILGVSPSATQQEIRAAYQRLIQQYHPDRVAGMGQELREVAERRTKEINSAYDELKRK